MKNEGFFNTLSTLGVICLVLVLITSLCKREDRLTREQLKEESIAAFETEMYHRFDWGDLYPEIIEQMGNLVYDYKIGGIYLDDSYSFDEAFASDLVDIIEQCVNAAIENKDTGYDPFAIFD